MGKHLKTQLDYDMINQFAKEVSRLEPDNEILKKYLGMDNFEGAELRKLVKGFPWADKIPAINGK